MTLRKTSSELLLCSENQCTAFPSPALQLIPVLSTLQAASASVQGNTLQPPTTREIHPAPVSGASRLSTLPSCPSRCKHLEEPSQVPCSASQLGSPSHGHVCLMVHMAQPSWSHAPCHFSVLVAGCGERGAHICLVPLQSPPSLSQQQSSLAHWKSSLAVLAQLYVSPLSGNFLRE